MVTLTKEEKDYIINLLEKQLKEVKKYENIPDDYFYEFAEEVKIEEFLSHLINKLKKI